MHARLQRRPPNCRTAPPLSTGPCRRHPRNVLTIHLSRVFGPELHPVCGSPGYPTSHVLHHVPLIWFAPGPVALAAPAEAARSGRPLTGRPPTLPTSPTSPNLPPSRSHLHLCRVLGPELHPVTAAAHPHHVALHGVHQLPRGAPAHSTDCNCFEERITRCHWECR